MSAIGGLLGLGGGAAGTSFAAPGQANIEDQGGAPLNIAAGQSYAQNQGALAQQSALLDALAKQNGLGNQSSVFNQLQNVASGQGPNPAQAMLNQATGANVANQAALMAGQRGAGSNVGLMARQAAQQGAGLQQQAVGQGATMQANQSLGALGQMGGIANTQVANQIGAQGAMTAAQQAEQANLLNALAAQNSARVSSQSSVNAGNTALSNTQMQGQQKGIGGLFNSLGSIGGLLGIGGGGSTSAPSSASPAGIDFSQSGVGNVGTNSSGGFGNKYSLAAGGDVGIPQPQGPASSFGQFLSKVDVPQPQMAPSETTNSGGSGGGDGGGLGGVGGLLGGLMGAGKSVGNAFSNISKKGEGGPTDSGEPGGGLSTPDSPMPSAPGPSGPAGVSSGEPANAGNWGYDPGQAPPPNVSRGGMVDVVLSPGEKVVPPSKVDKAAGGKVEAKRVPGKAKVAGDDEINDTYKTKLPAGSIVVPRTKSKDNRDSAAFVRATLAKRGRGK